MTLTNRLLFYFLSTLGLVLICFSLALYTLANIYWHRQGEIRLGSLLDTLRSAAEVARLGLEWEPSKRHLNLGFSPLGERSIWIVTAGNGQIVDQGDAEYLSDFLRDVNPSIRFEFPAAEIRSWRGNEWLAKQEWIQFAPSSSSPSSPLTERKGKPTVYRELGITVGLDQTPIRSALRLLAVTLVVLSATVWLIALFAGRLVCRQALRPISQMADAAAAIEADRFGQRIPLITTADEVGQLNRSFNSLLERMQTAFERQRRFTGDASHQLRTPLAGLLGHVEIALRRDRTVEEYRQTLEVIRDRGSYLAEIVDSLLFLSRADSESQLPGRKPIDLSQWLPEVVSQWKDHARFNDLRLEIASTPSTTIVAQPILLTELLSAVIDNAMKFTVVGSTIDVRLNSDHEWARISVEDHGTGISPEDLTHLGQPFFRSKSVQQQGIQGVGLGLSIAMRLANVFGGKLTMTSQLGIGSIVRVELPLQNLTR